MRITSACLAGLVSVCASACSASSNATEASAAPSSTTPETTNAETADATSTHGAGAEMPVTKPAPPSWINDFGLVTVLEGSVLCFSGRTLKPGSPVTLFDSGSEPVARAVSVEGTCPDEPMGRSVDGKLWHRGPIEIKAGTWEEATPLIGYAPIRPTAPGPAEPASFDIDGDGAAESFAHCTSSEGVHFTVWSGEPRTGKRLWHAYYYLGYDLEASCTEAESAP